MKKYVIDGRQLLGQIGGVQRYIYEIVMELDAIAKPGEFQILIPKGEELEVSYKNLEVKKYGNLKGLLWEQIDLPLYLMKTHYWGIFPCTIAPILYPKGIAVIHDVMIKRLPDLAKTLNLFSRKMLLLNYWSAIKFSKHVVTVSEFSKKDIVELYHVPENKVSVIGNSWQHMNRIHATEHIESKFSNLQPGNFYFSLSANRKQKNFKWIYEVAKRNPNEIFAIAGTQEEWQKKIEYDAPNIIHLGFISDEDVKGLMQNCKAFLFPSTYEGFGIPPMEALSVGAKIVVARSSCLPEIYGSGAYYIDPYDYEVDLDALLKQKVDDPVSVLERYGWDKSAERLYKLCIELQKRCVMT